MFTQAHQNWLESMAFTATTAGYLRPVCGKGLSKRQESIDPRLPGPQRT